MSVLEQNILIANVNYHVGHWVAIYVAEERGFFKEEGLALGLSSGVNVAGAIRLARELGPGKTIVTMLCDPATRYQSRLFNPEFLRSKGLQPPDWLENREAIEPAFA